MAPGHVPQSRRVHAVHIGSRVPSTEDLRELRRIFDEDQAGIWYSTLDERLRKNARSRSELQDRTNTRADLGRYQLAQCLPRGNDRRNAKRMCRPGAEEWQDIGHVGFLQVSGTRLGVVESLEKSVSFEF